LPLFWRSSFDARTPLPLQFAEHGLAVGHLTRDQSAIREQTQVALSATLASTWRAHHRRV
jgi:hypothetical protein